MTPTVREQRSHRIAVVFGGEADAGVAQVLDSLVSLRRADVTGVFIEDHSVFRTAELPFTTEVCRVTTTRRPLTTSELERQTSVLALHAERALRRIAERAGSPWTFRRHRGRLSTALGDARDVDFVLIGTARRALASAGERRATARTVRAAEAEARRPVVLLFEASEPAMRALEAAIELAERTGRSLLVLLATPLTEAPQELRQRLAGLGPSRASIRSVGRADASTLHSLVRRTAPAVLVLAADEAGLEAGRLGDLQREMSCPLVVVR